MELIKKFWDKWKNSYIFRTFMSSTMSTFVGFVFIVFNGYLGLRYGSLWNGTICIYYILLTIVRGSIVFCQRKTDYRQSDAAQYRIKVSKCTHVVLFVLNLALIVPISILVRGEIDYKYGLIPAIAMAAYTIYRIVLSSLNLKRVKKESNCLVRELRVINMIDTLVAILLLQNALIMATDGGMSDTMRMVTMFSGGAIFAFIVIITIRSMILNTKPNPACE